MKLISEVQWKIDKNYYYIQLNTPKHKVKLELFADKVEADKYFNLVIQDRQGLKDSFVGLQSIPIEEFVGLSIIAVHERYGHQLSQACVRYSNFITGWLNHILW